MDLQAGHYGLLLDEDVTMKLICSGLERSDFIVKGTGVRLKLSCKTNNDQVARWVNRQNLYFVTTLLFFFNLSSVLSLLL